MSSEGIFNISPHPLEVFIIWRVVRVAAGGSAWVRGFDSGRPQPFDVKIGNRDSPAWNVVYGVVRELCLSQCSGL